MLYREQIAWYFTADINLKMALCRTGGLIWKKALSIFGAPVYVLPSSVNLQKRHAARKGYREKVKRQRSIEKMNAATTAKEESKLKKKFTKITKTLDLKKPEPPNDDIFLRSHFNYVKYSLPEVIQFHREYHHPTVFNNPSAPVSLKIEIRMVGKKETQVLKPFSGVAPIPHPYEFASRREVLVFCQPEDVDLALKCGATIAGGAALIKKVKEGTVQPALYEYVIAHNNIIPELNAIRSCLKLQYPRAKQGTITNDLKYAINKFLHGVRYQCVKVGDSQDFGIIDLDIGTLDMEINQLEENFAAVIKDIEQHRPKKEGKFITWIWCLSRPSQEQFSIDLSQYIKSTGTPEALVKSTGRKKTSGKAVDDEDDDDDEEEEVMQNENR